MFNKEENWKIINLSDLYKPTSIRAIYIYTSDLYNHPYFLIIPIVLNMTSKSRKNHLKLSPTDGPSATAVLLSFFIIIFLLMKVETYCHWDDAARVNADPVAKQFGERRKSLSKMNRNYLSRVSPASVLSRRSASLSDFRQLSQFSPFPIIIRPCFSLVSLKVRHTPDLSHPRSVMSTQINYVSALF